MRNINFLILLVFCVACQKQETNEIISEIKEFEVEQDLVGHEIFKDVYDIIQLTVIDTFIVANTMSDRYNFRIFSSGKLDFLGYLGEEANSPFGWGAPRLSDQFVRQDNGICFWVNDGHKYDFRLININQSLAQEKPVVEKEFNIKPEYALTQNLIFLNDSTLVGNLGIDAYKRSRLKAINPFKDEEQLSELFPPVKNKQLLDQYDLYILYFNSLRYNEKHSKFVSALNRFNRIDVFNENMVLEKSIVEGDSYSGLDAKSHKKPGMVIDELNTYYIDLYCSDKYIYALFKSSRNSKSKNEIRVFNWNYKPLYNLKISESLVSFSVDEKNGFIYGVNYEEEKIMRYDFNLLNK